MKITHDNKTLTPEEWSKITGIPAVTISSRIYRKWTPERTLSIPRNAGLAQSVFVKITKNEAELHLNDCGFDGLPENLKKIMLDNCGSRINKVGAYLRRFYPKDFNEWFANSYVDQIKK